MAYWAAFNWLSTLLRLTQLYTVIPAQDYWRIADKLKQIEAFDLRFLWQQHNEHRIVFPDIVFALDVWLLHARKILPLVCSFLCYAGSFLILAWLIARVSTLTRTARVTIVLLIAILMGWKGSTLVLADPFLLQWTLVEFASLLSLLLLTRVPAHSSAWPLGAVIAAACVATYSSANGLLLWFVLCIAALLQRFRKRCLAALVIAAVFADGLYFVGYRFPTSANFLALLLQPWNTVRFVASYLSMPFGGMKSPNFGVTLGLVSFCMASTLYIVAVRHRLERTPVALVLFGFYAFTLFTALLTAAGRITSMNADLSGAKATRYLIFPLVNWCALFSLLIWIASVRQWRLFTVPVVTSLIALLLGISFVKLRWWLQANSRQFVDWQITELSLQNRILDYRLLLGIYPDPHFVTASLPLLESRRLSIYCHDRSKWVGNSIMRFGLLPPVTAEGAVTKLFPVESGFEVIGWTAALKLNLVLLVNEQEEVIGLGRRPPVGVPAELLPPGVPPRFAWIGFVNQRYAKEKFSVYVSVGTSKKLLKISESYSFPTVTIAAREQARTPIPGVTWRMDAGWVPNGMGPFAPSDVLPPSPAYGSWHGSDGNTGVITSSEVATPENGCVIVPVLHGPSTKGLSVELLDSEQSTSFAQAPMQDRDVQWEFWRIPVPESVKRFRIVARDQGRGLGQWLAIAPPELCR
jgi:hypothetical protein